MKLKYLSDELGRDGLPRLRVLESANPSPRPVGVVGLLADDHDALSPDVVSRVELELCVLLGDVVSQSLERLHHLPESLGLEGDVYSGKDVRHVARRRVENLTTDGLKKGLTDLEAQLQG